MRFPWVFIVLALAATGVSSCEGIERDVPSERVVLRIDSFYGGSKAAASYEKSISTLDVLVFRSVDGMLDAYGRAEGQQVTVDVAKGVSLDYYVVANAPAGALRFTDRDTFLSGISEYSDNAGSTFLFEGHGTKVFSREEQTESVSLDRYACKVQVDDVKFSFMDTGIGHNEVVMKRVFLVNVCGTEPWSREANTGSRWYNPMAFDSSLSEALVSSFCKDIDREVTSSEPVSVDATLYCYPNPTDNAVTSLSNPQWSVRDTRVVIEVLIGGVSNYYPINIPAMESNRCYHICNVNLIGQGSGSPDILVSRNAISYTVTVNKWGEEEKDIIMGED